MSTEEAATAGFVVIEQADGTVLGVSRRSDHTDFGFPGGKCDPKEPARIAAARELFEETMLVCSPENLVLILVGKIKQYDVAIYKPKAENYVYGTPTSTAEGVVRWCTWDELFAGTFGTLNKLVKQELDTK
jgi:8-oxo-dGTP pyrophosphatase MutT (NUDIX family)